MDVWDWLGWGVKGCCNWHLDCEGWFKTSIELQCMYDTCGIHKVSVLILDTRYIIVLVNHFLGQCANTGYTIHYYVGKPFPGQCPSTGYTIHYCVGKPFPGSVS